MADLCYPCNVHYDYIIKFENLQQEADFIIEDLYEGENIHFPDVIKSKTQQKLETNLRLRPQQLPSSVAKIYEEDFRLFEYA